jgi:hypothetical protein
LKWIQDLKNARQISRMSLSHFGFV